MEDKWKFSQTAFERHELLVLLKTTVEGLLANYNANVWSTYGGLGRTAKCLNAIFLHGFRNKEDFWNFVRGLRWLSPVLGPFLEKIQRTPDASGRTQQWLEQSLLQMNLSKQIRTLFTRSPRDVICHFYHEEAFLRNPVYLEATLTCLQAVETNNSTLLAEVNPYLLQRTFTTAACNLFTPHLGATPAPSPRPVPLQPRPDAMLKRRQFDPLVPPLVSSSPRSPSVLEASLEVATPEHLGSNTQSAEEYLISLLGNNDADSFQFPNPREVSHLYLDPLLHLYPGDLSCKQTHQIFLNSIQKPRRKQSRRNSKATTTSPPPTDMTSSEHDAELDQILDVNTAYPSVNKGSEVLGEVPDLIKSTGETVNRRLELPSNGTSQNSLSIATGVNKECSSLATVAKDVDPQRRVARSNVETGSGPARPKHSRSKSDIGVMTSSVAAKSANEGFSSSACTLPWQRKLDMPGSVRRPSHGQSLQAFLHAQDFHTCTDLDRENAHFVICEVIISAFETMKWNKIIRPYGDQGSGDESEEGDSGDEVICDLKQQIRLRRQKKLREKARNLVQTPSEADEEQGSLKDIAESFCIAEEDVDEEPATDGSNTSEEIIDEDISDLDAHLTGSAITNSNLASVGENCLSLSMGSLYSEQELKKAIEQTERLEKIPHSTSQGMLSSGHSAENVALSLLRKFEQQTLPGAFELQWIVSEQDAPQALLPLPNSISVDPDEKAEETTEIAPTSRMRGNQDWAPPRPQIVFHIHPYAKRKVLLANQKFFCAGCGAKVEPGFMNRYRYCEYLGKYFCQRCHSNDLAFIPARILQKWDFTKYYVSNFSRDFLTRIYNEPLFNIQDINVNLYRKNKYLEQFRDLRAQLSLLKPFLSACRLAEKYQTSVSQLPSHWSEDEHTYSLEDLVNAQSKLGISNFREIVNSCISHVKECELCQARGFICEMCTDSDDVIFPFEISRVVRCSFCKTCFHSKCFVENRCPKCIRLEARRRRLQETSPERDEA